MDTLYIIIPAYNEEENIESCVNDWYPIIEAHNEEGKSRLVVINDGSKDHTGDILLNLAKTRPMLVSINKPNSGHGPTVRQGYRYAIENDADWIFQTDSDGQTSPAEFEDFWKERLRYDAIIGNRENREDGKIRQFVQKNYCFLLYLIFGTRVKDANAPYRLMKTELVRKYIEKLPNDTNIPNILLTACFVYCGESVLFLPIPFKQRKKGSNTINIKQIIRIGWRAVGDFFKLRRELYDERHGR